MKKTFLTLIAARTMALSMTISAFAGSWQQDNVGWWWQNDDGSYPVNCWQWIDGNNDGIAESYYFNAAGYLLTNTSTPDGYQVDANGAWVINGVVQTQAVAVNTQTDPQPVASTSADPAPTAPAPNITNTSSKISSVPYDGYTIVVNTNTKKYHKPTCKSVKDIKAANIGYCSDSAYLDANGYKPCKNCH